MTIRILHLTDVHISSTNAQRIKERINALLRSLERENFSTHFIIFSGDATNKGAPDEYQLFSEQVIRPLTTELPLSPSNIIITPGNHDINRARIDKLAQAGLKDFLGKPSEMDDLWDNPILRKSLTSRHDSFFEFAERLGLATSSRILEIDGVALGFACINSAWLSASDSDRGNLAITRAQLRESHQKIADADFRIAIWHHPLSWLHDSDSDRVRQFILQNFHLCTTGHLHQDDGAQLCTPSGNALVFSGPALHAPAGKQGYLFYEIDIQNRTLTTLGFRWNERDATFVRDTEFAEDGRWRRDLDSDNTVSGTSLAVRRTVNENAIRECVHRLQRHLPTVMLGKRELSVEERFLEPQIVEIKPGSYTEKRVKIQTIIHKPVNYIIEAPLQSGKSALLDRLGHKISITSQLAVSCQFADISNQAPSKKGLITFLSSVLNLSKNKAGALLQGTATLLIDNCDLRYSRPEWTVISSWLTDVSTLRIIAAGRPATLPSPRDTLSGKWQWLMLRPLSIQSIKKELARLETLCDPDGQVSPNIQSSIATIIDAELPRWPWVILLLFDLTQTLSPSNLRTVEGLLRKYTDIRLGAFEAAGADRPKIRARMLRLLATEMIERQIREIPLSNAILLFNKESDNCGLDVNGDEILSELFETQLITRSEGGVSFTFFVLQEFYHAEHLRENLWSDVSTLTINDLVRKSGSLALFAEMVKAPALLKKCFELAKSIKTDVSASDVINSLAHLKLSAQGADEAVAKAKQAVLGEEEIERLFDETEDSQKGTRERLALGDGTAMPRLEQFIHSFATSVAVMRGGRFLEKPLKRESISDSLDLAVCLVAEIAADGDLLRAIATQNVDSIKRREITAVVNALLVLVVANMLAVLGAGQHLAQTVSEMFRLETDDLRRLMLLMWYMEIGGEKSGELVRDFLAHAEHSFSVRLLTLWLTGKFIMSTSLGEHSKDEAERLLRMAAEEQARRLAPHSAAAVQVKREADRIVQAAKAIRETHGSEGSER